MAPAGGAREFGNGFSVKPLKCPNILLFSMDGSLAAAAAVGSVGEVEVVRRRAEFMSSVLLGVDEIPFDFGPL